ncbi:MAG: alpha/beta fold hydrolase [Bradymonadia bacterium]
MEILIYLVAIVALVVAHIWFWKRHYSRLRLPDERHFVATEDGWRIALNRIRANPEGPGGGRPVICCHGLACNHRFFDLDAEYSLGRHLAEQGFDVFLLDLRGAGGSEKPGFFGKGWTYGIIDHARFDVPAALEHVRTLTGEREVLWVGHSMGGLVALLAGAEGRIDDLGGLITLGTPTHPDPVRAHWGGIARWLRYLDWLPSARIARWCALVLPFAGRVPARPVERMFFHPEHMRPTTQRAFMAEVLEDVPRKVIRNFVDAILHRQGLDGRPADQTLTRLEGVKWPYLAIAGNLDRMAPIASVQAGFEAMGSPHKHMEVLGGADGDWGHVDLVLGHRAPEVVYPRVSRWLLERASTRETSSEEAPSDPAS